MVWAMINISVLCACIVLTVRTYVGCIGGILTLHTGSIICVSDIPPSDRLGRLCRSQCIALTPESVSCRGSAINTKHGHDPCLQHPFSVKSQTVDGYVEFFRVPQSHYFSIYNFKGARTKWRNGTRCHFFSRRSWFLCWRWKQQERENCEENWLHVRFFFSKDQVTELKTKMSV